MVSTAQLAAASLGRGKPLFSELVFWGVYGLFCMVLVLQILTGNNLFSPYLTIIYVPFYMLGYVAGTYGKKYFCWNRGESGKVDCKKNPLIRGVMSVAFVGFLWLVVTKNLNSMESKIDTVIQMAASLLGSMAIIYGVFYFPDGKIKNFFAKLGLYTLEIYVIHYHFANLLNFHKRIYDFYTPEGFVFVMISFAAMSVITFVIIRLMKKVRILDAMFFGKI